MKRSIIILFGLLLTLNTAVAQSKKELKEKKELEDYAKTRKLIDSGTYEFTANWATTQSGRRIDLITNPNYIRMKQQEADIFLPYFGVVQNASVGMNGKGGIEFKGKVEGYKVEYNEKKRKVIIKFKTHAKNERFDFILSVYSNGTAYLSVMSNYRNSISYDGKVTACKKPSDPENGQLANEL